ncbi:MAG: HEAT repeat domain-containing protein [Gemmatimonadetes bacterium]|nr:HEAT repeat domain-containing protein [Gemmatimonadota bacterium]
MTPWISARAAVLLGAGALSTAALVAAPHGRTHLDRAETLGHGDVGAASPADTVHARAVLAAARGASPLLCAMAARSLEGWGGGWSAAPIPGDEVVRATLRWTGGERPSAEAATLLAGAVGDADACVRRIGATLAGRSRDPAAVRALRSALGAAAAATRAAAALGLGFARDTGSLAPLGAALRDDAAEVRATAAWALGRIGDTGVAPGLRGALEDADRSVRRAALWALGQMRDSVARDAMIEALKDQDPEVRRTAARALGGNFVSPWPRPAPRPRPRPFPPGD